MLKVTFACSAWRLVRGVVEIDLCTKHQVRDEL